MGVQLYSLVNKQSNMGKYGRLDIKSDMYQQNKTMAKPDSEIGVNEEENEY